MYLYNLHNERPGVKTTWKFASLHMYLIFREEMSHFLSTLAGVPLGDVLVSDIQAVNISGHDCLTALLWITGVDGMCIYVYTYMCG